MADKSADKSADKTADTNENKSLIVSIQVALPVATANVGHVLDGMRRSGIAAKVDGVQLDSATPDELAAKWGTSMQPGARATGILARRPVPSDVREAIGKLVLEEEGPTQSQIADEYGISLGTVARIARAAREARASGKPTKSARAKQSNGSRTRTTSGAHD